MRDLLIFFIHLIAADAVAAGLGDGAISVDDDRELLFELCRFVGDVIKEAQDTGAELIDLGALRDLRIVEGQGVLLGIIGRGAVAALHGQVILAELFVVDPQLVFFGYMARDCIDAEVIGHEHLVAVLAVGFHIGKGTVLFLTEDLCVLILTGDPDDHVALGPDGLAVLFELDVINLLSLCVLVKSQRLDRRLVGDLGDLGSDFGIGSHLDAVIFFFGIACGRDDLLRLDDQTAVAAVDTGGLSGGRSGRLDSGVCDLPMLVGLFEIRFCAFAAILTVGQRIALLRAGGIYLLGLPAVTGRLDDRILAVILETAGADHDVESGGGAGGRDRRGVRVDM